MAFLLFSTATIPVVPLPPKGSKTVPFSGQPALMTTTGYVYSKDKKHLKTFASYDDNEESFSDRNVFPIGCIKELKKILI